MMEKGKKRLIVVLGMHRSGTSAITRGLQVMGIELGNKLMPAIEGVNAKGFWEDLDLFALDNELLGSLESDWHHLAPIESDDVEALRENGYFGKAVELLRQKVDERTIFGFKDPRVAKLLPFWKEVFADCQLDTSYVLVVRHPLSVVKSLARRDGFDAEKSYFLWLGHVVESLYGSTGSKRVLVDYDKLMQSPELEINRIAKRLGLEIDPAELESYTTEFLDKTLRHTIHDLNDLSPNDACPPLVREIYLTLREVATDKISLDDVVLQDRVARWVDEYERLKPALALVDTQTITLNQTIIEFDEQINTFREAVAERDRQINTLREAVAERDHQIATLNQVVAEGEKLINNIGSSRSWRMTHPLRVIARVLRHGRIR